MHSTPPRIERAGSIPELKPQDVEKVLCNIWAYVVHFYDYLEEGVAGAYVVLGNMNLICGLAYEIELHSKLN